MEIINQNTWFVELFLDRAKNPSIKKIIKDMESICNITDYYLMEFSIIKRYVPITEDIRKSGEILLNHGLCFHIEWMAPITLIDGAARDLGNIIEKLVERHQNHITGHKIYLAAENEEYKK